LGTSVDEINRVQEENAESAKLIVYANEFEINLQQQPAETLSEKPKDGGFHYTPLRIHGLRLTPDGQDHVRQIANLLHAQSGQQQPMVIVERSQTSKHWETQHQYPVHFNDELDALRREVVVNSLLAFGILNARELVVVAPAFPTGLNAEEAAAAHGDAIGDRGSSTSRGR
jgi:hypothetical protein